MQRVTKPGHTLRGLAMCLAFGICVSGGTARGADAVLDIWAAASLREPVSQLARRFETQAQGRKVNLVFGASSALARQIQAGAPADVFLSADDVTMDRLQANGFVRPETRRVFASNQLVVVAARELTVPLAVPNDLLRPEVKRIALAAPEVPVGRYARQWLTSRGLAEGVKARAVVLDDARATLASVDSGNAEAGIVYVTDARVAKTARIAFAVPDAEQPYIVYVGAVMVGGDQPELADDFLRLLVSQDGLAALHAAGFRPPPAQAASSPDAP
ncbi:MAG TPA: molybdate ABC transporter substrate-binding protein [Myxococcota bacterium]|nr:molybdate ABC transporter substrate-binding protein [Myxococcota bacterium]